MALVGKYTKYEHIDTGKTETQTIEYPSDYTEEEKAGTTESVEVPIYETLTTVYENSYVVVHSVNTYKQVFNNETDILTNITFRVYKSTEDRQKKYQDFILEDYILSQPLDYSINKTEIEQAYDAVKSYQGCEELKND